MLQEIESLIVETIIPRIQGVPRERLFPKKPTEGAPAVYLSCRWFRFEPQEISESNCAKVLEVSESLVLGNGEKSRKLKNNPERGTLSVTSGGKILKEGEDFTVDYACGELHLADHYKQFEVLYKTKAEVLRRTLKLTAKYAIDVIGDGQEEVDRICGEIVRTLLLEYPAIEGKGVKILPLGGLPFKGGMRLFYKIESEVSAEFEVGVIKKIEVGTGKKPH
ncbi:MAG: hypothetical protein QFX35_03970 [Candidatus Verstraetearchaeota archaeon]|nr:hypothetical protein [Candidatus Verstraetearchaeota archaeon]